jgi:hypothetical protein
MKYNTKFRHFRLLYVMISLKQIHMNFSEELSETVIHCSVKSDEREVKLEIRYLSNSAMQQSCFVHTNVQYCASSSILYNATGGVLLTFIEMTLN